MIKLEYQLINPVNQNYTVLEQILVNRGIEYKDIPHYLNTNEKDILSPLLLDNMREAAIMLARNLAKRGKIYIQVDEDCDGYSSSAVLMNYLHDLFPTIVEQRFYYGVHEGKAHGIDLSKIQDGTVLVIVPDASSNEEEIHQKLYDRGIDVLVLDHHQVDQVSKYACVVNNQLCDYPSKALCGAGIVYKFCQYLDSLLNVNYALGYRDLVALAEIADVMDQRDFEMVELVREGLSDIRNPFLYHMIAKNEFKLGANPTPMGIAFYVAPFVNAVTRVGTVEEKQTLFEAMLKWKAFEEIPSTKRGHKGELEQRVEQAVRNCTNIKSRQTRLRDKDLDAIEELIQNENLLQYKILAIRLRDFAIDRGLTGLIANELMGKYQRPVLLLNKVETEEGILWSGSARGSDNSKIRDLRQFVIDSGYSQLAQGHQQAFGCAILDKDFSDFLNYIETQLADVEMTLSYKVDFIYQVDNLNPQHILDIGELSHLWGQKVQEPYITIEGINITKDNLYLMARDRNPTLKITLPNGVSCIKFKSNDDEFDKLYSESGCVVINAVGRCEINEYNGRIQPQIIIQDYEIVKRQEYYF